MPTANWNGKKNQTMKRLFEESIKEYEQSQEFEAHFFQGHTYPTDRFREHECICSEFTFLIPVVYGLLFMDCLPGPLGNT